MENLTYETLEVYRGIAITCMSYIFRGEICGQISFQYNGDEIVVDSVEEAKEEIDNILNMEE